MGALEGALAAHGHHSVDELSVALHCDSLLIHFVLLVWVQLILLIINRSNLIYDAINQSIKLCLVGKI